jgi:hypothetical protein
LLIVRASVVVVGDCGSVGRSDSGMTGTDGGVVSCCVSVASSGSSMTGATRCALWVVCLVVVGVLAAYNR